MKFVKLLNGAQMPMVGLGTWRASQNEIESAVLTALESGYRHIDTAFNYNTEEAIGSAVKKWVSEGKGTREELFITTKLPNFGNRPSDVERFLKMSLQKLSMEYVDLYLIHMPFSFKMNPDATAPLVDENGAPILDLHNDMLGTWKEMEQQVKNGLTKSIGLSNFNESQIALIHSESEIKPAVLQVELHAYFQQKPLVKLCKSLNIAVTAYSPLGSPGVNQHFTNKYNYNLAEVPDILGHPQVLKMAEKYNKTTGQVLLKHLVQNEIIVIPKSGNPGRIRSNYDLFSFELDAHDLEVLNALDKGENGRIFDFLFFKGVEKHPNYPFTPKIKETFLRKKSQPRSAYAELWALSPGI